jgi:hypothetical protein
VPHYSQPHNPDIANAFFRAGEIEAWGRGIQRIFDACRMAKAPTPVVPFEANSLWVEFPFSADYVALIRGAPVEAPVETLVRTPSRVLAFLHRQPAATLHEVAAALGLSTSAVERAARRLQEEGRLRRVGPKKGGHAHPAGCAGRAARPLRRHGGGALGGATDGHLRPRLEREAAVALSPRRGDFRPRPRARRGVGHVKRAAARPQTRA